MDWAKDYAVVNERDVDRVFGFDPQLTTVVRLLNCDETPIISSLSKEDWNTWIHDEIPPLDGDLSGLILVLARRPGSNIQTLPRETKVQADEWLQHLDRQIQSVQPASSMISDVTGHSDLRKLPFSRNVFLDLARKMYIHNSILRTVSRADVPVLFNAEVEMELGLGNEAPAYVYNCRSSNSWPMDLALAATHIPSSSMTFAVVFGCSLPVERTIINRLKGAMMEASHPLLMPGIFVELERVRNLEVIENSFGAIEKRIVTRAYNTQQMEAMTSSERDRDNQEKRDQWLNTTYLRNYLAGWNEQLRKLEAHTTELIDGRSQFMTAVPSTKPRRKGKKTKVDQNRLRMQRISIRIRMRISEIVKEYDDRIRDCTMRVDGMTMAIQWTQSETNLETAVSTGRDSRYMKSIALVTMIFLPATFLASFFSMTFFNWFDGDGKAAVSSYLWIYVVVSTILTLITLGIWWCCGVWCRKPQRRKGGSIEKELLLV